MRRTCTFAAVVGLMAAVANGQVASTVPTTEMPVLGYRFVEGRRQIYEFQLVANVAGARTTSNGLIEFSVASSRNGQVSLQFTHLPVGVSMRAGPQPIVRDVRMGGAPPPRIPLPRFGPSVTRPETSEPPGTPRPRPVAWSPAKPAIAVFSQNGELLSGETIARMPLLVGFHDQFVIAPLSPKAAADWSSSAEVTLIVDERGTTCPAKEETRYTIVASKPPLVYLAKSYQLHSAADDKGVSPVTMRGLGSLEFDTQAGMFRSLAMTYVLELARDGDLLSIPISVSYRKFDDKEMAVQEQKEQKVAEAKRQAGNLAEAHARASRIMAEARNPQPFTPEVRAAALRDLKTGDFLLVRAALSQLAHAKRDDHAEEVSAAIVEAMASMPEGTKHFALDALEVWGTARAEAELIAATKSVFARDKAMELLGRDFKDDDAIAAVVSQFQASRMAAAAALKKIGPAAEKSVLPLIKEKDFWIRNEAIGVLRDIGGQRSLHALNRELQTYPPNNMLEVNPFHDAIAAIEKRVDAEYKTGGPQVRVWADLSGTFEIEATLQGVKDHKALLKKSDGRELAVPLEKLSEEDQQYVTGYLKAQAEKKPENPFQ